MTGDKWTVTPPDANARQIKARRGLSADSTRLSLSFIVSAESVGFWRQQFETAGNTSEQSGFAGQFRTLDEGGRTGPTVVDPPATQSPPFAETAYYVTSYNDEPVGGSFIVSLNLRRLSNRRREFDFSAATLTTGDDWTLTTTFDTLSLRSDQLLNGGVDGTTSGPQRDLSLLLSDEQTGALYDALGYPGAAVTRDVPGDRNVIRDTTPGSRQTLTLTDSPDVNAVPDGEHIVSGFSIEIAGESTRQRWLVELTTQQPPGSVSVPATVPATLTSPN